MPIICMGRLTRFHSSVSIVRDQGSILSRSIVRLDAAARRDVTRRLAVQCRKEASGANKWLGCRVTAGDGSAGRDWARYGPCWSMSRGCQTRFRPPKFSSGAPAHPSVLNPATARADLSDRPAGMPTCLHQHQSEIIFNPVFLDQISCGTELEKSHTTLRLAF